MEDTKQVTTSVLHSCAHDHGNFYKETVWEKSMECTMQSNLLLLYWQNQGTFKSIECNYDCEGYIMPLNQTIKRFWGLQRQRSSRFSSGFVDNCETTY